MKIYAEDWDNESATLQHIVLEDRLGNKILTDNCQNSRITSGFFEGKVWTLHFNLSFGSETSHHLV